MATSPKKKPVTVGKKVSIVRRNGAQVNGVVATVEAKGNGTWVGVNTASGRKAPAQITTVRESQLRSPI